VTTALRWWWVAGAAVVGTGLLGFRLVPDGGLLVLEVGLVLVAVAAGATAARGASVGPAWRAVAWCVPALPVLVVVAVFAWLAHERADPMAVVLLYVLGVAATVGTWIAFGLALLVEVVRRRRRRFGEAGPAWENGPTPPSYS
jgi:hypothetical protein